MPNDTKWGKYGEIKDDIYDMGEQNKPFLKKNLLKETWWNLELIKTINVKEKLRAKLVKDELKKLILSKKS